MSDDKPLFSPRISDDPMHRLMIHAENRARRNGASETDAQAAGRKAIALRKLTIAVGLEPNVETILQVVAGIYSRRNAA